ncbi:uncharacterized protein LOC143513882 isoform X2 [Brachyhypopomus gauderio]|uniref:uncharacterized protein LOC143513882 isoform X2 n=1 Tax=Brachyhypopomus gauderio TaxID=698409 RepID=UPI0040423844
MSTELVLLQAGLGRRTVVIPEDAQHSEISNLLLETYPKMDSLQGAWMLYKAVGTLLHFLEPVIFLSSFIYFPFWRIREFDRMPKAQCATCHVDIPIQLLALHAQKCEPDTGSALNPMCSQLKPQVLSQKCIVQSVQWIYQNPIQWL